MENVLVGGTRGGRVHGARCAGSRCHVGCFGPVDETDTAESVEDFFVREEIERIKVASDSAGKEGRIYLCESVEK